MQVKIDNQAHLCPLNRIPAPLLKQIKARLTFPNPAHQEAGKWGFLTWNISEEITNYRQEDDRLIVARGLTRQLAMIIKDAGLSYRIEDRRRDLPEVGDNMTLTPLKALRSICLRCAGGSTKQVRECPQKDCPGFIYRMGKNPLLTGRLNRGSFVKTHGLRRGKISEST